MNNSIDKPEPSPYNAINKPEQPNTELMIIKTIQGLVSTANRELGKLDEMAMKERKGIVERAVLIGQALEDIDIFQRTTLNELQKAFE